LTTDGPSRWLKVKSLLERALAQPEGTRRTHVIEGSDGDATLTAEVMSLLDSHTDAGAFFDKLGSAVDEGISRPDHPDRWLGESVEGFRTVELVGHGGMGFVYSAESEDPEGEPPIAVKILAGAAWRPRARERFHRERDGLARLRHRYIARILGTGDTSDGVPFYSMELIDGEAIDTYSDRHRLTVPERVRLVLRVCEAVTHAHENQVIHRDLKPSNILVRENGDPALLDFGIAKLLDPVELGRPSTLSVGLPAFTPGYASPEHEFGDPVSAASDVYSLGVLLYRLLAGALPPVDSRPERPSPAEIFERQTVDGEALATARSTKPGALSEELSGPLSSILVKASRTDPTQRYQTVTDLADALEGYLASGGGRR